MTSSTLAKTTPSTIEYANARVRGHRTHLFSMVDWNRLLGQPTFDALISALLETKYRPHIQSFSLTNKGAATVGAALTQYLREEFDFVVGLYTPKQGRCLRVISAQWDIDDIKTIIRGKAAGVSPKHIVYSLVSAGVTISRVDLELLARQKSLQDVVDLASTLDMPYAQTFREGAQRASKQGFAFVEALSDFELLLDKEYTDWALKELSGSRDKSGIVKAYVQGHIDARNIIVSLRAVQAGEIGQDAVQYFIEGGLDVDLRLFKKLVQCERIEDAVELLRHTRFGRVLSDSLAEYALSNSLSVMDRTMYRHLLKVLVDTGKRDVLGMGVAVAYLQALENEAVNMRLISHGKSFNIPDEIIRKELIVV